jgi:hypothetical protein
MMCSVLEFPGVEVTKASAAATIKWPFCQILDEVSLYSNEFGFDPAIFFSWIVEVSKGWQLANGK